MQALRAGRLRGFPGKLADGHETLHAQFGRAPADFTVSLPMLKGQAPRIRAGTAETSLREVTGPRQLTRNTWCRRAGGVIATFDLPKGASRLEFAIE